MIESVEVINWRDELNVWGWYKALQDKIQAGEFRLSMNYMENGVSSPLAQAFRGLESTANKLPKNLASMLGYLNFKMSEVGRLEMPFDGTDRYWLRINGRVMNIELADEYEGGGSLHRGLNVVYIDKEGEDEFWLKLAAELTKACLCQLPDMHEDFAEEWTNWCP